MLEKKIQLIKTSSNNKRSVGLVELNFSDNSTRVERSGDRVNVVIDAADGNYSLSGHKDEFEHLANLLNSILNK